MGKADFSLARFASGANFGKAALSDEVGATFDGEANFLRVVFIGKADFTLATFAREANFRQVTFTDAGEARSHLPVFLGVTLNESKARCPEEAQFALATFNGKADFGRARFNGGVTFVGATFNEETDFVQVSFVGKVDFCKTTFSGRTLFAAGSGRPDESRPREIVSGAPIFAGAEVDFRDVMSRAPDGITLLEADLTRCRFRGSDLRKLQMVAIKWPNDGSSVVVYDEILLWKMSKKNRPWEHVERLYRELKQNYEDRRDYERAGDFTTAKNRCAGRIARRPGSFGPSSSFTGQ